MRTLLLLCYLLLLPMAASAQDITFFREISGNARLDFSGSSPLWDDAVESGPSTGPWSEITSATVSDPEPDPSGMALGGGGQTSDPVFSNGEWTISSSGGAFAQTAVSDNPFRPEPAGLASGFSGFSTSVDVQTPTAAHLDVLLEARVRESIGAVFPIYTATLAVCRVGGECQVDLSARQQGVAGLPERVTFNDTLVFSVPGTYTVALRALAAADASADDASSDGIATWSATVTLPEPSPTLLGLVAVLVVALTLRARRPAASSKAARADMPRYGWRTRPRARRPSRGREGK